MFLNLIKESSHCLHHVCELPSSESPRDEHRDYPREDLKPDFLHPQHSRHLLIYLEKHHAYLGVCLAGSYFIERLEDLVFHCLLINHGNDLIEDL